MEKYNEKLDELRKLRNRILWSTISKRCPGADRETIADVRELRCREVTGFTRAGKPVGDYKSLTVDELQLVIEYVETGTIPSRAKRTIYASSRQLAMLHHIAMRVAVHYAVFPATVGADGRVMDSYLLQVNAEQALSGSAIMHSVTQHALYEWIVPKTASMLSEWRAKNDGAAIPVRKNGNFIRWAEITQNQCEYLINRYNAIYAELVQRYNQPPFPYAISLN